MTVLLIILLLVVLSSHVLFSHTVLYVFTGRLLRLLSVSSSFPPSYSFFFFYYITFSFIFPNSGLSLTLTLNLFPLFQMFSSVTHLSLPCIYCFLSPYQIWLLVFPLCFFYLSEPKEGITFLHPVVFSKAHSAVSPVWSGGCHVAPPLFL